jgi:transcriptional regulator with XRE-family HTH domain
VFSNLQNALRHKNITQKAVAELLGCTEKTLQNKIQGRTEFTLSEILAILENLLPEYSMKYLFENGQHIA